ncbi:MAG: hypothetical protein PHF25_08225 [Candidatus Margulisbacteria bacterium]|nr:hypothetical protein [Candidatus Margulisiibacteriota bacterium]
MVNNELKTADDVKEYVDCIFNKILEAQDTDSIKKIIDEDPVLIKNKMNVDKYPRINFDINKDEIDLLINQNVIDNEGNIIPNFQNIIKNSDAITKLFYVALWKNGDLTKIKHIIQGIRDKEESISKEDGLVFYHFGKYLKNKNLPIIDQHVLRAFAIYKTENTDSKKINKLRKLSTVNKSHKKIISDYKKWSVKEVQINLKNIPDYLYYIDKTLFALGKAIKIKDTKDQNSSLSQV